MYKILVSVALGAALLLPSAAFALDSFNNFSLANQIFDPASMTCNAFMSASPGMKMFVSSWYDGDATMGGMYNLQYSRTDVLDMQANLIKSCGETPNETLQNLYFDYGGTEPDYEDVTCQMFNNISNVGEAANLLSWAVGYFAYTLSDTTINGANFISMGNGIIPLCAAAPGDQLTKYVYAALELGSTNDYDNNYWTDDYNDWGWDSYGHQSINFTIPSYFYDKNINN